jgi:hypothetical protein
MVIYLNQPTLCSVSVCPGSMTRHAFNSRTESAISSEVLERRNSGKREIRETGVAV